ncbi:MAG: putative membrane protein SpoIIM required for sporulation [Myxococcota bacterium]|jgi:uncharacterized membrane protein SpoIIM required for sporulation
MSDRDAFVAAARPRWDRLEHLLLDGASTGPHWEELAALYRGVCADLARAQSQGLPRDVLGYLDDLSGRGHNALYGSSAVGSVDLLTVITRGFPAEVRRSWVFFWLAMALFYGPYFVGLVGGLVDLDFATTVLPASQLEQMEEAYSTNSQRGNAGEDAAMAGFYVYNNVGIAFRCFATGALFGLGSIYFLVYNGLIIGTVSGYLGHVGLGGNLFAFTCGHSAWELTAIVISGAAGMKLGWALIDTGGRTRAGSLRAVGPAVYRLVAGAAFMLFVAAAIEGFWSASPVPVPVKWVFAGCQVIIVTSWLSLGGRRAG